MNKGKRRFLIVLACVVALTGMVTASVLITKSWVKGITWDNPSLDQLADGDYPGQAVLALPPGAAAATAGVKVIVHVGDHHYTSITVVDPQTVRPALAEVSQEILAKQSLKLDSVTGATVTKVAFLRAVANAVSQK